MPDEQSTRLGDAISYTAGVVHLYRDVLGGKLVGNRDELVDAPAVSATPWRAMDSFGNGASRAATRIALGKCGQLDLHLARRELPSCAQAHQECIGVLVVLGLRE